MKKMTGTRVKMDTMTGITGENCVKKSAEIAKFNPMNKNWKQPGRGFDTKPVTGTIPNYKNQYDGR
jgi:hypothetical protein